MQSRKAMKKGGKARYPASPGAALSTSVNKSSTVSMFSAIFISECPSRTLQQWINVRILCGNHGNGKIFFLNFQLTSH